MWYFKVSWVWPPFLASIFLSCASIYFIENDVERDCQAFDIFYGNLSGAINTNGCKIRQSRGIYFVDSFIKIDNRKIPIVAVMPKKPVKNFILHVVGGPSDSIQLGETNTAIRDFASDLARRGVGYVSIGYSGTFERSRFPEPNLPLAVEEIEGAFQLVSAGGANVCFFGQSLGGYLTLEARKRASGRDLHESRVVLYNPLLLSGLDSLAHFDGHPEAKRLVYHAFQSFSLGRDGREETIGLRHELRRDIFVRFFGDDIGNSPLGGNLSNVHLIYSSKEPSLGAQNLALAKKYFGEKIEIIDSESHTIPEGRRNYFIRRRLVHSVADFCFPK
jgi:hypothetical protein